MISFHAISFIRATQSVVQNNTAFRVPASGTSMHFSSIPSVPENAAFTIMLHLDCEGSKV